MKKILYTLIIGPVLAYLLLLGMLFTQQRSMMYFPPATLTAEQLKSILPENTLPISVTTEDKLMLKAYLVPPKDKNAPILLVFHGNGMQAAWMAGQFQSTIAQGAGVLLAEYRGYVGNPGFPHESGFYKDADAYFAYIKTNYPDNPLVIYGQSLGSGVAVDLASRNAGKFDALVLEVPFDSMVNLVGELYPYVPLREKLLHDKYHSDLKIVSIKEPKLFLLAGRDEIVSVESGKLLYDLASEPKQIELFENATHMTVYDEGASIVLNKFLAERVGIK